MSGSVAVDWETQMCRVRLVRRKRVPATFTLERSHEHAVLRLKESAWLAVHVPVCPRCCGRSMARLKRVHMKPDA